MTHNNMYQQYICTKQQLDSLKLYFKEDIDSKRSYDRIQSLKDLINILIKRECTSKLDYISSTLTTRIGTQRNHDYFPSENNRLVRPVLPCVPADPVEQIDELIATEIGHKWKYLARALNIREGKIDEFDANHKLEESVREILCYHRRITPGNCWKIQLCNALEKARRKDLRLQIEDILTINGMM